MRSIMVSNKVTISREKETLYIYVNIAYIYALLFDIHVCVRLAGQKRKVIN